ncbi:MAG: type I-G CRISPR-associated helicase/endonuclease Cas3g [Kofleriaceae bacterium]
MSDANSGRREAQRRLARALDVPEAFPWQHALLDRMLDGELPSALDVPTGLGKTAVIAIWLIARAAGAPVPRRLVYVVDRRAVVDQATSVAEALRAFVDSEPDLKTALGLERQQPLPISTLRGQFLDNRTWLADPSSPAIVLGTVDMVGSRLLFEGYGVSRRMRPYHAGMLGADSLVVLDEAHLVPPFERLLRTISRGAEIGLGAASSAPADLVPRFHLLPLSATGRADARALALGADDRAHLIVARRLAAVKRLELRGAVAENDVAERLAEEAWGLTASGTKPMRCIVFCNRRDHAQAVRDQLVRYAGTSHEIETELFVGARRVWEREEAARWLSSRGFLAGTSATPDKPTFVIATSAGEVGVDLDADHMISDLVAWERMVQRLGRVNRRGDSAARVVVIPATPAKDEDGQIAARQAAVTELLHALPRSDGGSCDASPGALTALKTRAATDEHLRDLLVLGSTPDPLHPPLTRPLVEAWSMTSLEDHTGRPEVQPWLRGWEPEEPQTTILWRELLPITRQGELLPPADREVFFSAAGPQLAEQLQTETWRAMEWLTTRLRAESPSWRADDVIGVILGKDHRTVSAQDLADKHRRDAVERRLAGATLMIDTRVGGLEHGLLDLEHSAASDVTTLRRPTGEPALPLRVQRTTLAETTEQGWRTEARIAIDHSDSDEEIEWIVIQSLATEPAESEEGRAVGPRREQKLEEHHDWTEQAARAIADRLRLVAPYRDVLALAARLHDEGKRAARWQQAFHAPAGDVYGKTRARPNIHLLAGYRHELGSVLRAERDERVLALDEDLRDLCLHLIAAHHGHARPLLRTDGAEEPPSKLASTAQAIALRFTRMEKHWGPWGLAWWEALLRAADQQASRRNDEEGSRG